MSVEIPRSLGSEKDSADTRRDEAKAMAEDGGEPSPLRGRLVEELRAKQREDEEESSQLRGRLLKQIADAEIGEAPESPQLRGTLLAKTGEGSAVAEEIDATSRENEVIEDAPRLRGTLLEGRAESLEPFSKEWLMRQTYIQRDSKAEFVFDGFHTGIGEEKIRLVCPEKSAATSQALERFIQRLQVPGEAWSVKGFEIKPD